MQGKKFYTQMSQSYYKKGIAFQITILMCIKISVGQLLDFITNTHRLSTWI